MDLGPVGEWAEQNGGGKNTDRKAKLLHLSLFSSWSHFVQQMNDSLDLLKPAKLVQYRQCTVI